MSDSKQVLSDRKITKLHFLHYCRIMFCATDFVPLITGFGLNGDGFDKATAWPDQSDIRIHCDAADVTALVIWHKSDGSPVGTTDQNLRQTFYPNGTTVLQIASNRRVSYCDAGAFSCIVTNNRRQTQQRTFTLLYNGVFTMYIPTLYMMYKIV